MQVVDVIDDPGRYSPLMKLMYEDFSKDYLVAPLDIKVGDVLEFGPNAPIKYGDVLKLANIPEGIPVFNVELKPGDGGKLVRSSGLAAYVVSHEGDKTVIKLPSKNKRVLSSKCRATVGIVAGSGRTEKPFVKAGAKSYARKLRNKEYPRVSRVSMNACNHPFGGSTKPGRQTCSSRNAPPGAKVGNIAPRKTGRTKVKKVEESR